MKLWKWEKGRQETGYEKFTLIFSPKFRVDAYILCIPAGVGIPKHTDPVPHAKHFRWNLTFWGHLRMDVNEQDEPQVYRRGDWLSYFRPDIIVHWAAPVKRKTFIFSVGWLR